MRARRAASQDGVRRAKCATAVSPLFIPRHVNERLKVTLSVVAPNPNTAGEEKTNVDSIGINARRRENDGSAGDCLVWLSICHWLLCLHLTYQARGTPSSLFHLGSVRVAILAAHSRGSYTTHVFGAMIQ